MGVESSSLSDCSKCTCHSSWRTDRKHSKARMALKDTQKDNKTKKSAGAGGGGGDFNSISDKLAQLEIAEGSKTNEISLEEDLPKNVLYYGWFFSHEDSIFIKQIALDYFAQCRKVPQFERFLNDACTKLGAKDPETFYRYPRKPKSPEDFHYHITAKFLDREDNTEYSRMAQNFVGKKFQIHLVGLYFSKETFGIRMKLTEAQKFLFDDREGTNTKPVPESSHFLRKKSSKYSKNNQEFEMNLLKSELKISSDQVKHPKCTSAIHTLVKESISFVPRDPTDFQSTKSRAHVTIGCGPKVKPIQTGIDLMDIINLEEQAAAGAFVKDFPIDGGTLRQFGRFREAFVVYPCHELIMQATFNYII